MLSGDGRKERSPGTAETGRKGSCKIFGESGAPSSSPGGRRFGEGMKKKNIGGGLNIARIGAGALSGTVLAALFFALSGTSAGQARQEMRRRMYDEQGARIKPPRRAACKRVFDEKTTACINQEIRKTNLNAPDSSFYKTCPLKFRAEYRSCLGELPDLSGR